MKSDKCQMAWWQSILILFDIGLIYHMINIWIDYSNNFTNNYRINYDNIIPECDDYLYGCCEIIESCSIINNTKLKEKDKYILNPHQIVKHDIFGSNCPSFNKLINIYNNHLLSHDSKANGCVKDNNCCQINTNCDTFINFINIDLYLLKMNENRNLYIDKINGKCPFSDPGYRLIEYYNRNYPKSPLAIIILDIIFLFLSISISIGICHYSKEENQYQLP